jgi:transcriptional regulator with XRE-family HTH domain
MSSSARNILAANLRRWRSVRKLPLKHVARDLGIAVSTWSQWETGKRFPPDDLLDLLANYMRVPVCHLLCPHPCSNTAFHGM